MKELTVARRTFVIVFGKSTKAKAARVQYNYNLSRFLAGWALACELRGDKNDSEELRAFIIARPPAPLK